MVPRWFPALRQNTYGVDLCEVSTEALSLLKPIQQSQWRMLKRVHIFTDGSGGATQQSPAFGFVVIGTLSDDVQKYMG